MFPELVFIGAQFHDCGTAQIARLVYISLDLCYKDVDRTELYLADEVFSCGNHVEVQAVGSVDKCLVGDREQEPVVS